MQKQTNGMRRLICLALVLAMVLGMLPSVFAESSTTTNVAEVPLTGYLEALCSSKSVADMDAVYKDGSPYAWQSNSELLGQKITAIEVPVKSVAAIDGEQTFTLSIVDAEKLKTGGTTTIREQITLKLPATQLAGCTASSVDKWIRIDGLNIQLGAKETLAFGAPTDTVNWGHLKATSDSTADGAVYMNLTSGITAVTSTTKCVFRIYTEVENSEPELRTALAGKKIAFMGDSITTWQGFSNNASRYNSSIGNNCYYYKDFDKSGLTVNDTWWMQAVNQLGLSLTANNSSSGSRVIGAGTDSKSTWDQGYQDRPYWFSDNTVANNASGKTDEPDIIVVYMGMNDATGTAGTYEAINFDSLITADGTSYTYATPSNFAEAYAVMIHKISVAYPNADLFLCNIPQPGTSRGRKCAGYNAVIQKIAERFDAQLVDFYGSEMSGESVYTNYALTSSNSSLPAPDLHPDAKGFDVMTKTLMTAMKQKYLGYQPEGTQSEKKLIAHWDFDTKTSDGKVKDITGNGHDGTIHGDVTFVDGGVSGKAAKFAGDGQLIEVADAADLQFTASQSFTLSTWVKREANESTNWKTIVAKGRTGDDNWYGLFLDANNKLQFGMGRNKKAGSAYDGVVTAPTQDAWVLVTAVQDGENGNGYLYVDGALVKTYSNETYDSTSTGYPFVMGGTGGDVVKAQKTAVGKQEYFRGQIDDMRLYNYALSAAEIKALYDAKGASTSSTKLLAHWTFDAFTDDGKVKDVSGNGHHGTPVNSPTYETGVFGNGVKFNGTNQAITVDYDAALDFGDEKSYTMSLWVKRDGSPSGAWKMVAGHGRQSQVREGDENSKVIENGHWYGFYENAKGNYQFSLTGNGYEVGEITQSWKMLTATYDAGSKTLTIYENGTKVDSFGGVSNAKSGSPYGFLMGWSGQNGLANYGEYFKGMLDDVRLYSGVLSETEVKALYSAYTDVATKDESLVAYWTFDETMTDGKVKDMTGKGHDGTLYNNPELKDGKNGKSIYLTGTNYMQTAYAADLDFGDTDSFTLSAWAKWDAGNGWQMVCGNGRSSKYAWYGIYASGTYQFSDQRDYPNPAFGNVDTSWHQLTASYDGTAKKISLYYDGKLAATKTITGPQKVGSNHGFLVGCSGADVGEYFQGAVDNVRVYNRALSAAEALALYTADGAPASTKPITEYVKWTGEWPNPATDTSKKNIIFDSDAGPDGDDTAALTMLFNYANEGKINLLATVSSTSSPYSASFLSMMNTYYGYPDVPVGTLKSKDTVQPISLGHLFNINLTAQYETQIKDGVSGRDAVDVYRDVLSKAADGSVTIVVTGMQTNLMDLLKSGADSYSELSGMELIKKKVKLVSIMGGQWPSGAEFNIQSDPESAKYVCENWPTPIVYSGFSVGEGVITQPDTANIEADSPLRTAWWRMNSWDETSVLYAVEGDCGYWTLKRGDAKFVGASNYFTENSTTGARAYLVEDSAKDNEIAAKINKLANAPKKNNPDELEIHAINGNSTVTTGTWSTESVGYAYGSDAQVSSEQGATMSLTFTGTAIDIYGTKGVGFGRFDVYMDGTKVATVDTNVATAPTWTSQWLWGVDNLSEAKHALKIVLLDAKKVSIDFLKYVGAVLPPEEAKLIAHWTFDDFTEDGKVKDVTGKGHDGEKVGNPTFSTGKFGNGVKFNGTDQAVTVTYAEDLDFGSNRSYSLSLWAKNEGATGNGWRMVAGNGRASNEKWYGFYAGADSCYQFSESGQNWGNTTISSDWQMLTATYDANSNVLTVYSNGTKVGSYKGEGGNVHAGSPYGFLMGWSGKKGSTDLKEWFNGMLDDVRVYTGVLTDAEVTALYNGTADVAVTSVSLNKSTLSLKAGTSETLTATISPTNATNKALSWESSKTSVATVDQNGKVTAVAAGTATITVKSTNGKSASCAVTVTAVANAANYQPDACVKVIFDTDIDSDVDDAGALAVLAAYAQQGKAEILAVGSSAVGRYQAACADAILTYYGFTDVPIAAPTSGNDVNYGSNYNQKIAQVYENKIHNNYYAEDPVKLYRQTLAAQEDNSVVMIFVGTVGNLVELLKSPADSISPLTGKELVEQKVKLVSAMMGEFPTSVDHTQEHNLSFDVPAAKYLAENCPAPIMYSGWELGNKLMTGGTRSQMEEDNPVRKSYDLYCGATGTRQSWDLTSVVFAVEGLSNYWTAKAGTITIQDNGHNGWTESANGKDAYLVEKMSAADMTSRINELMVSAKKSVNAEKYVTIVDDADSKVTYTGTWRVNAANSIRYNSTGHNYDGEGASVKLTFNGTGIEVFGGKDPAHGKAAVYIDGQLVETIDTYQAATVESTSIFKKKDLTDGEHTIEIKILHEKSDAATGYYTDVDYFRVIGNSAPAPEPEPDPELVAHWTFDDFTTDGKVKDVTGNGHDGTIYGTPTFVDGMSGKSIRFAADGQLVVVPDDKDLQFTASQSFTLSTWVKREANSSNSWKTLVTKGRLHNTNWYGLFLTGDNKLQFGLGRNGYGYTDKPTQDEWLLVTVVQDGKNGKAYVYYDGVLTATYNSTYDSTSTGYPFVMGGTGGDVLKLNNDLLTKGEYFRGQLDDMRIYNYALSAAEIKSLYDTTKNGADKTALNTAIANAEGKTKVDYCAESWAAMQTALTAAKSTAGKANATQDEVNTATSNLNAAIQALTAHNWATGENWSKDASGHWHACSGCSEKKDFAQHTPDREAATETEPVKCSDCGYVIQAALGHSHSAVHYPRVEPSYTAAGNIEYWYCAGCNKYFADEDCTVEITLDATVLPKLSAPVATPSQAGTPAQQPFNPNAGQNTVSFPFVDVPSGKWYYSSVKSAWEKGLIDGVNANEFKPDANLTVAQAIKLAAALHQLDKTGAVLLTNGSPWYSSYVNYAVANGIIESGYASYTAAELNATITREEFVHILNGAMDDYAAKNSVADNAIPDVKTTDKYGAEIYEFYRAGILTGSDANGTFNGENSIKRSEVAAILVRMYDASARQSIALK